MQKTRMPARHRFVATLLLMLALPALGDTRLEAIAGGTELTPALSGLQISLMREGEPAESYAFGFAQRPSDKPEPLRQDHKVRVASISKLVLAIGIMRLVDNGQLRLDTDVSQYLGWPLRNPAYPDHPITARQLLSHTSSIRDGSSYFIEAGAGELRDFFTPESSRWESGVHFARIAKRQPGRYFEYANLNFGVLATVIERVAKQRFDVFMTRQVLEPLGITASFNPCDISKNQRAAAFRKRAVGATDWDREGAWFAQVDAGPPRCFYGMRDSQHAANFLADYQLGSNATLFSPQGGLRASANDLVQVLRMLAAGGIVDGRRVLSAQAVAAMLAPNWTLNSEGSNGLSAGEAQPGGATDGLMSSYGLSVHRIDPRAWGFEQGPRLLLGHLGEAYGVLSHTLFDPQTGNGIATIITGTAEDPAGDHPGHSPLYRVEEEILRWWLAQ